ncbi:hypothetical protein FGW37_01900 [Streptomyces rectiverticillatus]|uniref:hypothetical protein n=1 Tax=Streptomyces rectiverticillatus TaxID=173860 RepID=UPI0015C382C4|nr:hypothetical protein [Streptomyces rectiverticillatus]QLE70521.1 hypothetical protein FGW37_01900 [Streptomyces rectiverticillatus]
MPLASPPPAAAGPGATHPGPLFTPAPAPSPEPSTGTPAPAPATSPAAREIAREVARAHADLLAEAVLPALEASPRARRAQRSRSSTYDQPAPTAPNTAPAPFPWGSAEPR